MSIRICLSAASTGFDDETDYDAWVAYVTGHVCEACDLPDTTEVDGGQFVGGPGVDLIYRANEEQEEAIRRWLSIDGWDAFCSISAEVTS